MKHVLWVIIGLGALAAASLATALVMPRSAPPAGGDDLAALSFQPHAGAHLPLAVRLVDERGSSVTLGQYFARTPVILVLEYLRCTSLCGVTLRHLMQTLSRLPLAPGRDYQLVAVSIDPRDTPQEAAAARADYAAQLARPGSDAGIHVLTGAPDSVRQIADAIGFRYRYDRLLDAYIHPAGFVVASPSGSISRYLEGVAATETDLIAALGDAEEDKAQGPLTRLLLLCHVQGAPVGRLTVPVLAAFMAADVAAGLTLIVVFAGIRRRRHG